MTEETLSDKRFVIKGYFGKLLEEDDVKEFIRSVLKFHPKVYKIKDKHDEIFQEGIDFAIRHLANKIKKEVGEDLIDGN